MHRDRRTLQLQHRQRDQVPLARWSQGSRGGGPGEGAVVCRQGAVAAREKTLRRFRHVCIEGPLREERDRALRDLDRKDHENAELRSDRESATTALLRLRRRIRSTFDAAIASAEKGQEPSPFLDWL